MKRLDRYILTELLEPFFISLGVIIFVLLANFLIKSLDKLLGKGLSFLIILEFIYLNMAWILALAVPMAVLVAALMAFGRLSEENEITAMRASGISFVRILIPAIGFSLLFAVLLIIFNDRVLPEFNHRARLLRSDIYKKRPSLNIEPGYFMDDLPDYSMLVKKKKEDHLEGVIIYNKESREVQTTIYAKDGDIAIEGNDVILTLYNGEIHELNLQNSEEYRRVAFNKHIITIPVDDLLLERRESSYRGDREMTIAMMKAKVQGYRKKIKDLDKRIRSLLMTTLGDTVDVESFRQVKELLAEEVQNISADLTPLGKKRKQRELENTRKRIEAEFRLRKSYQYQINRYLVEIYKKFSIPAACLVFILIGAPMGNMARKGGIAVGVSLSILFFLIYWAFLIGGEELADMGIISPFWAMWSANFLLLFIGIYLIYFSRHDQTSIDLKSLLLKFLKSKNDLSVQG